MDMTQYKPFSKLTEDVHDIIRKCREHAAYAINIAIIRERWEIGRRIVHEDQGGELRAEYGKQLLAEISKVLTLAFGTGYSQRSLAYYRQIYLDYPEWQILHTRVQNLTWSHIKVLLRVEDLTARDWYFNEAAKEMWSVKTLDRNVGSQYYYRLLASPVKDMVKAEMQELTSGSEYNSTSIEHYIKSPIVTEFLGLPKDLSYTESDLESALITHLQQFMMELGKGYAYVERQQRIVTDTGDFFIDLVFYNYIMKCFVLIDLKTTKLSHQDVGQMDMYVRMYDKLKRIPGDNPTIGIVLCAETSQDIARYSVLNGNPQLYASKYLTLLPDEESLLREIDRQKNIYLLQHES